MQLSIIVRDCVNKEKELGTLLSRLTLNKSLYPEDEFETIVVDHGSVDNTKELCCEIAKYIPIKYLYADCAPFCMDSLYKYVLPMCKSEKILYICVDDWISEHIVHECIQTNTEHCAGYSANITNHEQYNKLKEELLSEKYSALQIDSVIDTIGQPLHIDGNIVCEMPAKISRVKPVWISKNEKICVVKISNPPKREFCNELPEYSYAIINDEILDLEEYKEKYQ